MPGMKGWKDAANRLKGVGADASFEGIVVRGGEISHGKDTLPLRGARATVEAAGEIDRRLSATRVVMTGGLGLFWKKKVDKRELYLTVENDGAMFVVPVDPDKGAAARQFAAKLNTLAARS